MDKENEVHFQQNIIQPLKNENRKFECNWMEQKNKPFQVKQSRDRKTDMILIICENQLLIQR